MRVVVIHGRVGIVEQLNEVIGVVKAVEGDRTGAELACVACGRGRRLFNVDIVDVGTVAVATAAAAAAAAAAYELDEILLILLQRLLLNVRELLIDWMTCVW